MQKRFADRVEPVEQAVAMRIRNLERKTPLDGSLSRHPDVSEA